jgi:TonB family protein
MDRCRYKALKRASLDDSLADCDRAAKLDPVSDEVREARAFAYQRFGQSDKAMEAYDILTRRPSNAIVHFSRAMMELDLRSTGRAKAHFVAARKADPTIDIRVASYLKAPAGYEASNPEMKALLAAAKDEPAGDSGRSHTISDAHSRWKPSSIVTPYYPNGAEDDQVQGYVDFEFVIEPDGSVGDPKVTAEMPEAFGFADAAIKVFPKWKFTPQTVDGATVPTKAYYRFSFKLR